ncbi:hypothetical protein TNCV_1885451 [Trichonephila clavipes]|nr:hypothetical protein TNCV_1885451 [Trichonephila clavipes]
MVRSKVYEWYWRFEEGRESTEYNECLQLHETLKMLRWCLDVFEKIVAKHLNKSLRLHTSRRRHLRESIRRKRLQFWRSDDWYLLQDNAPAH